MKTPDEIKKGLECCTIPVCAECPYDSEASCVVKNEDALAYIRQLEAGIAEWEYVAASPGAVEDMAREIDRLEMQKRQTAKRIQQLEAKVPTWISVEERLPEEGKFALLQYAKNAQNPTLHARNTMAVGRYEYGMFLVEGCSVKITHWMPLPEPPEV